MENKGPFYEQIDAFLSGHLPPGQLEAMQKALTDDPELAREVELRRLEFDVSEALIAGHIREQLRRLTSEPPPEPPSPPPTHTPRYLFWLIAVLLTIAAIGIYRWSAPPASEPAPEPPPSIRQAPPASPTPQAADDPNSSGKEKTRDKPENGATQRLALATELYQTPDFSALRGQHSDAADPFEAALAAWEKQDYAAVLAALQKVPAGDPKYIRALTLRAHAQFKSKQFASAGQSFRAVADSKIQPWAEEADWYLLLALLADGQTGTPLFRARLDQIRSDPGHPYWEQAGRLTVYRDRH